MVATLKENGDLLLTAESSLEAFAIKDFLDRHNGKGSAKPAIEIDTETYKKEVFYTP
jgi:hypothetical protein